VRSLASTSSIINSGNLLDKPRLAGLQIENAGLVAQDDALRLRPGPAQRHRETGMTGEVPTLRDRADERGPEDV
jgi:hypothetical protein